MMTKAFNVEDLYKVSETWTPEFRDGVLYIDNFYEDPEAIHEHLTNRDFPLWKYNGERGDSRNGIDYNDCRIIDKIGHPSRVYHANMQRLLDICRQYWWKGNYSWQENHEFNCFQTISQMDTKYQHYPHIDSELKCPDETSVLNMLVYMDKEESGGTAVYGGEWITNDEQINVLYPVEERFNIEQIIPAKFNRCAIFPGNRMHGAYIADYNCYSGDKWRISQVTFFHPDTRN